MPDRYSFTIPPHLAPHARSVAIGGGLRLHLYAAGPAAAPPLVLVHGLGDEADTWRRVFLPLAERWRVIAIDLPGFGRSDRPRAAYTPVFFARALAGLLDALGIQRATLLGSSMGAAVAQRLALAAPGRVERLVLVGGALPVTPGRPPAQLLPMLTPGVGEGVYTSLRGSQEQAYQTLRPYYADLDGLPEADREFLRERVWARVWSDGQRRAFLSALRWLAVERALRAAELRGRLAALGVPTLLVWGARDVISPLAGAEAMAALLPDARLVALPDAGHLPHQERAEDFLAALQHHTRGA